jgi:hypothetical protein
VSHQEKAEHERVGLTQLNSDDPFALAHDDAAERVEARPLTA